MSKALFILFAVVLSITSARAEGHNDMSQAGTTWFNEQYWKGNFGIGETASPEQMRKLMQIKEQMEHPERCFNQGEAGVIMLHNLPGFTNEMFDQRIPGWSQCRCTRECLEIAAVGGRFLDGKHSLRFEKLIQHVLPGTADSLRGIYQFHQRLLDDPGLIQQFQTAAQQVRFQVEAIIHMNCDAPTGSIRDLDRLGPNTVDQVGPNVIPWIRQAQLSQAGTGDGGASESNSSNYGGNRKPPPGSLTGGTETVVVRWDIWRENTRKALGEAVSSYVKTWPGPYVTILLTFDIGKDGSMIHKTSSCSYQPDRSYDGNAALARQIASNTKQLVDNVFRQHPERFKFPPNSRYESLKGWTFYVFQQHGATSAATVDMRPGNDFDLTETYQK